MVEIKRKSVKDTPPSPVQVLGRSVRIIENFNSPIYDNEYRIALRVKRKYDHSMDPPWDYHFFVQTSTGDWAEKPGSYETRLHFSGNPNSIAWDEYYDSRIVYFAISS